MKYVIYGLFSLIGIAIGLIIGFGFFEGYELVLGIFIIFPIVLIFGLLSWKSKVKKDLYSNEKELKKQDRFSKWE